MELMTELGLELDDKNDDFLTSKLLTDAVQWYNENDPLLVEEVEALEQGRSPGDFKFTPKNKMGRKRRKPEALKLQPKHEQLPEKPSLMKLGYASSASNIGSTILGIATAAK